MIITPERLFIKYYRNYTPRWIVFLFDVLASGFSFSSISFIVLNFSIAPFGWNWLAASTAMVLIFRIISFLITRIYHGLLRYTSIYDAMRIFVAVFSSSLVLIVFDYILFKVNKSDIYFIPIQILVIDFFVTLSLLSAPRIAYKLLFSYYQGRSKGIKEGIAIFGAGESGIIAKRSIDKDYLSVYKVSAFLDDDEKKIGKTIEGIKIYNIYENNFEELVKQLNIKTLLIASQSISAHRKKELIEMCLGLNIKVKSVPRLERWINGELSLAQFQNVNIEDLLDRDEIVLDRRTISHQISGKRILVTGASGSIGSEIARQLSHFYPEKIYLLDQAESPLYELDMELREKMHFNNFEIVVGDIRNEIRMEHLFKSFRPHLVYHAAAYKHVPLMEDNPSEAINTNVYGTKVLADLSVKYEIEKFVFISTDKAVNPSSVMGCSKRIAEIYIQSLDEYLKKVGNQNYTQFITTRFGNVLGSNGSVMQIFRKQIMEGGPVTVTHPEITRYFMTIPEACQLVLEAGALGKGGEIMIFDMGESIKIADLAKKMIRLAGLELGKDIQIVFSGLRPGEKIKEELLNVKETTLPTHHKKILVAQVQSYNYERAYRELYDLIRLFETQNNESIVSKMKLIVPEFISKNSIFENLDT